MNTDAYLSDLQRQIDELDAQPQLSPADALRRQRLRDDAAMVAHARDKFSVMNAAIAAELTRNGS